MKRLESLGQRGPIFNSALQATMQGVGLRGGGAWVWGVVLVLCGAPDLPASWLPV